MEILGKDNQTLSGHIQDCLTVCNEILARREPFLRQLCQRYGWSWDEVQQAIRFAVWCHDIGKATNEWQAYIRDKGKRITHALPSFGIGLMVRGPGRFPNDSPTYAALLAVLAHHGQLHQNAFREDNFRWQNVTLPVDYINEHFDIFSQRYPSFHLKSWQAGNTLRLGGIGGICKAVAELKRKIRGREHLQFKVLYSTILNILTTSDAYASGNAPEGGNCEYPHSTHLSGEELSGIENVFPFYDNTFLKTHGFVPEPNSMQQETIQHDLDRIILNAGCGEGKTAAALLFAQKLLKENRIDRIIFTLPTKFTSNNLNRDLTDAEKYAIPEPLVGITHGDAAEFLRQRAQEGREDSEENGEDEIENLIMGQVFENSIYSKPITISTVDHLIMSLYHGYKFADRAFSNVASALVVFDEVHYYEKQTMGAIAETMRRLTELRVPHLVMTATIPQVIHNQLDRLVVKQPYKFQRAPAVIPGTSNPKIPFEIERLEETLIHEEDRTVSPKLLELVEQNSHRKQIIFLNQVARAKKVYQCLAESGFDENLVCYHSGFISKHRNEKERIIRALFKKTEDRKPEDIEALESRGFEDTDSCILVSTQVSELSLDISADVMYSEVAPTDSIVQRGGRLNRKGEYPRQDGYLHRLFVAPPYKSEKSCLPYDLDLLQRSWDVFGQDYSFQNACDWVNVVYPESCPLVNVELSTAINTDIVFGKKPQDNYDKEGVEETGRVVIRKNNYRSYDVVPLEFAEIVGDDFRNYKAHNLSISEGIFSAACQQGKILSREATQILMNRRGGIREIKIPFKVIQARYTFEVGLEVDEDAIPNIH